MKQIIDKLIRSNNTDDWLIAYELIIREYGSFYAYPRKETEYLYIHLANRLQKAKMVNYNEWETVSDETGMRPKYAQL